MIIFEGKLSKLKSKYESPIEYSLGDIPLNELIGQNISIQFTGKLECIYCSRQIKKSFNQGYCFPCSQSLARCDVCIIRPEKCHYHLGTCREPDWGKENCLIEHSIYLAAVDGVKIGITRSHQQITRWIDQGALSALPVAKVGNRLDSGLLEKAIKASYSDKTNWRSLLTGKSAEVDLQEVKADLIEEYGDELAQINASVSFDDKILHFEYPVQNYLPKALSANLDKTTECKGLFHGIRGQYLLIGDRGLNIRKHQGYIVRIEVS